MTVSRVKTGRRGRVSLQVRDLAVMEDLVLLRAETLDELHARHFTGLSRKRAINRLAQLSAAGYLSPADVVLFGETSITRAYTLGPKARTALERRSLASEHFRFRRWNPTLRDQSIPHQIVTNRLLDQIGGVSVPEHLLPVPDNNSARHRPDAVIEGVTIDGQRGLLGIEVDLGHYSRERILGKVSGWSKQPDHRRLLIVVPDDRRAQQVSSWVRPNRQVTVLTRDQIPDALATARSPRGEGILFNLDIWRDGAAWEPERERRAENERHWEQQEREEREQAELERQRAAAAAERARLAAQRQRTGGRASRRRFGG